MKAGSKLCAACNKYYVAYRIFPDQSEKYCTDCGKNIKIVKFSDYHGSWYGVSRHFISPDEAEIIQVKKQMDLL